MRKAIPARFVEEGNLLLFGETFRPVILVDHLESGVVRLKVGKNGRRPDSWLDVPATLSLTIHKGDQ